MLILSLQQAMNAEDDAFMAELLGGVTANLPIERPQVQMKPVRSDSRRKMRVLSPPVEPPRRTLRREPEPAVEYTATHAQDDEPFNPPPEDDVVMSDDALPSSPVASAVQRKEQPVKAEEKEDDDDDMLEVAEVTGHAATKGPVVNLRGSRPVPKIKKPDYPTPASSSPTRPPTDSVELPAWANVTDKLNLLSSPAPSEAVTAGKLAAQDAVEEDGSLRMFWTDSTLR